MTNLALGLFTCFVLRAILTFIRFDFVSLFILLAVWHLALLFFASDALECGRGGVFPCLREAVVHACSD